MDTTNIYKATEVNLEVVEESDAFYVVSTKKFWLLFLSTLGMYTVYWFYRNWALIKQRTGDSIWPIPRGIFNIFFMHSLCDIVSARLRVNKVEPPWSGKSYATLYVVASIIVNVADRLAGRGVGEPIADVISILFIPVAGWAMWQVQQAINLACNDSAGESNDRITGANIFWIAIGMLFWCVILIGLFAGKALEG